MIRRVIPSLWLGRGGYVALTAATLLAAGLSLWLPWIAATALVLAACCAAFVLEARRDHASVDVQRTLPARFVLGRAAELRVTVTNRGARRIVAGIVEAPVARIAIGPDERRCTVAPRASQTLVIPCTPFERGAATFAATYCWYEAGWRLVRHRRGFAAPAGVRVLPDVPAFAAADDVALRARQDAGARRLARSGRGPEFAGLRDYVPGDAYRDIDWKATARRAHITVTQHEAERSQQIALLIDAGRLMGARVDGRRKLDIAISAALGIAMLAQGAGDRVGVHAFAGATLAQVPPLRGPRAPAAIYAALAAVEPRREEPDYERAVLEVQRTYRKRSLIVLFTDLFDPVAAASLLGVLGLLVRRHVVVVALTNDGVLAQAVRDEHPANALRRSVARRLQAERATAVAALRGRGMLVIDVAAAALRPALLDVYIELKTRGGI